MDRVPPVEFVVDVEFTPSPSHRYACSPAAPPSVTPAEVQQGVKEVLASFPLPGRSKWEQRELALAGLDILISHGLEQEQKIGARRSRDQGRVGDVT